MKLDFVKGHCGWDTATLLRADEIPRHLQLATALKVLDPPFQGGIEVGLLEAHALPAHIRLRVADTTSRSWISMCGGISQVIGKALIETGFREHFGIEAGNGLHRLHLVADAGTFPIDVLVEDHAAIAVTTIMDAYGSYLYSLGVEPTSIDGVSALVVGEFLVFRIKDLQSVHPGVDFTRRDDGPGLDLVNRLLRGYQHRRPDWSGVLAMLYDDAAEGGGHFRAYPRFLGGDDSAARLPFEFQCGTGTVALTLALHHYNELPFRSARGKVAYEWGNRSNTPDPYGIRVSDVELSVSDARVRTVSFRHSVVEIVAEGRLLVPAAGPPPGRVLSKI